MSRPNAVNLKTFPLYDKLHTTKTKMMSGVEMTTLYPIKETDLFYISIEVWSYCASKFKAKKENLELKVEIPVITNTKTIDFLKENCWSEWIGKQKDDSELLETIKFLNKIFPDKKPVFFYELDYILTSYNHGHLLSYDDDGNVEEPTDNIIKQRKYLNSKYHRFIDDKECVNMRERWTSEKDENLKSQYLTEYLEYEREYAYKNLNLTDVFLDIGLHSVCYPVAFTKGTADWHIEKYGKPCAYAHAGEIMFVVTEDEIYFEVKRHF